MTPVPRSALLLAMAGVMPFCFSIATQLSPALTDFTLRLIGPRFVGPYVGLVYGTIILSFMSGVLWGFATKASEPLAAYAYLASVLPALWAFFFVGNGPVSAALMLAAGFALVLCLDFAFWRKSLAPVWWMQLRVPITAAVIACLCATAYL